MTESGVNIIYVNNKNDIGNLCRLCLSDSTEKKSLNSLLLEIFEENVTSLFDVMQKLSSTKLSDDPKYPLSICLNCVSLLTTAYEVNRLIEFSQTQLSIIFKEELEASNKGITKSDVVEIISDKGKFNLNDLLIVEDKGKKDTNYEGFLKNLGTVVSANFTEKKYEKKIVKEAEVHSVDIVPLSKLVDSTDKDVRSEEISSEVTSVDLTNIPATAKRQLFPCNQCSKVLTSKTSLYRHRSRHLESESYLCQICGKKYSSRRHLRHHMLLHKNERLYLCTICGKNFGHHSTLAYHMRGHKGEKRYKCTHCDRAFPMLCGLNRHLRTHTGLRPYKCSFCDKAFRSLGEVKCHEMIHTGFRPYHCKLCGKGFTKMHNLNVHMLSHDGPFICDFCQRGFTETTYLKLHMKVSHGLRDYDANNASIFVVNEETTEVGDLNEALIVTTE